MKASLIAAVLALAAPAQAEDECPPAFQGASLRVDEVPGGVRLEFRSRHPSGVAELRKQLRSVADMIEQHVTLKQTASETDLVDFPPVDLDVKDIALGARVTVRVSRLSDLEPVREIALSFGEYWKTSPCAPPLSASASENPSR